MNRLFTQFSFPGGISSHVAPTTPGSIHEGGELGYSLSHAFGAALDNPDLIVACVVGDGEAETGPLATAWQSTKFLDPVTDGAVLPILHLNGYKISNPTIARTDRSRRARPVLPRQWLGTALCRGRRSRSDAPGDGDGHGHRHRRDRRDPASRARHRRYQAPPLADDRPALAEGLDRPGRRRRVSRSRGPSDRTKCR